MIEISSLPRWSTRFYGFGIFAMAAVDLALGKLDPTQPVSDGLPGHTMLAFGAAMFLLMAGAGVIWKRTSAMAGRALAIYFGVIAAALMNGAVLLTNPIEYGSFFGLAESLSLAAAGLVVFAASEVKDGNASLLIRSAQIVFGLCVLFFGGAHFRYLDLTVPLVPKWLPPSPTFWAVATGLFHIAGGLAILMKVRARLGAMLLTLMYAAFTPLVHVPLLLREPSNHFFWTENALNLALVGTAWVIADSTS